MLKLDINVPSCGHSKILDLAEILQYESLKHIEERPKKIFAHLIYKKKGFFES